MKAPLVLLHLLAKRPQYLLLALFCGVLILVPTWFSLRSTFDSPRQHSRQWALGSVGHDELELDRAVVRGGVIMKKMGNETIKAELGRASWKLLHTMAARYPEHPTDSERSAYSSFLYLFSRLYPCGECSAHFQVLLSKYPPQTSSRTTASLHLCFLHNQVNARLGKEEFDCASGLEGIYDCGCGEEEVGTVEQLKAIEAKDKLAVTNKGSRDKVGEENGTGTREEEGETDSLTGIRLVGG